MLNGIDDVSVVDEVLAAEEDNSVVDEVSEAEEEISVEDEVLSSEEDNSVVEDVQYLNCLLCRGIYVNVSWSGSTHSSSSYVVEVLVVKEGGSLVDEVSTAEEDISVIEDVQYLNSLLCRCRYENVPYSGSTHSPYSCIVEVVETEFAVRNGLVKYVLVSDDNRVGEKVLVGYRVLVIVEGVSMLDDVLIVDEDEQYLSSLLFKPIIIISSPPGVTHWSYISDVDVTVSWSTLLVGKVPVVIEKYSEAVEVL